MCQEEKIPQIPTCLPADQMEVIELSFSIYNINDAPKD